MKTTSETKLCVPDHVDLYVIGPVSGIDDDNRPAFEEARAKLRACGYSVAIPQDFIASGSPWKKAMWASIAFMLTRASGVAILDGHPSLGSQIEAGLCMDVGKPIDSIRGWMSRATREPARRAR